MLTVVVLTRNEEANLAKCLDSLKFCDEILIVDDSSTDTTLEIAKKHKARVVQHALNSDFSAQRNYALSQITSGWILFVDADEVVTPELAAEIHKAVQKSDITGCFLPREDILWAKHMHYGDTKASLLRLARRGAGEWHGKVHETWHVTGQTATLGHPLLHYPHPTVSDFLRHINFYSTLRAAELKSSSYKTNLYEIIFYPIGKFFYLYLYRLGFLDNTQGFLSAMMMAFYSFLVRGKLYLSS